MGLGNQRDQHATVLGQRILTKLSAGCRIAKLTLCRSSIMVNIVQEQHAIATAPNSSSRFLPSLVSTRHQSIACVTIVRTNLLLAWSWLFRFIHIALDTIVLYGVLRERSVGVEERFGPAGASSGQRFPGRGIRRGSWKKASKPVADLPLII